MMSDRKLSSITLPTRSSNMLSVWWLAVRRPDPLCEAEDLDVYLGMTELVSDETKIFEGVPIKVSA